MEQNIGAYYVFNCVTLNIEHIKSYTFVVNTIVLTVKSTYTSHYDMI